MILYNIYIYDIKKTNLTRVKYEFPALRSWKHKIIDGDKKKPINKLWILKQSLLLKYII